MQLPVPHGRGDHQRDAGIAQAGGDPLRARQPLLEHQRRQRNHPYRGGIGDHRGPARRHVLQRPQRQRGESCHLQQAHADHQRPFLPRGQAQPAQRSQHEEADGGGRDKARGGKPERADVGQAQLHDRPVAAPDRHGAGEGNKPTPSLFCLHASTRLYDQVVPPPRDGRGMLESLRSIAPQQKPKVAADSCRCGIECCYS